MRLYLVRHGEAENAITDGERPLSAKGLAEAETLARYVRGLSLQVAEVWHSEKLRASQTASILVERGGLAECAVERAGLAPNNQVDPVGEELHRRDGDLCIVGHLPFLPRLISHLLEGCEGDTVLGLSTCAMVCLERGGGRHWWMRWFVTPEILGG